jgi:hypothetical protein
VGQGSRAVAPMLMDGRGSEVPVEHHSSTYFRAREAKERELADLASSPDIREIYLSLAERYRYLAENAEVVERVENSRTTVKSPA